METWGVYVNVILRDENWCFTTLLCLGNGCYLYPTDTAMHSNVVVRAHDASMMHTEVIARLKSALRASVVQVVSMH